MKMGKFVKKNANRAKTRKELRKEKRKIKKQKRVEYYNNRPGKFVKKPQHEEDEGQVGEKGEIRTVGNNKQQQKEKPKESAQKFEDLRFREMENDWKKVEKLKVEMRKQTRKQLIEANVEEDQNIKRLEKLMKLNKRKSKSIPNSFVADGLDYILDVCDEDLRKVAATEHQFNDTNEDFKEDFFLMTGNIAEKGKKKKIWDKDQESDTEEEFEVSDCESYESNGKVKLTDTKQKMTNNIQKNKECKLKESDDIQIKNKKESFYDEKLENKEHDFDLDENESTEQDTKWDHTHDGFDENDSSRKKGTNICSVSDDESHSNKTVPFRGKRQNKCKAKNEAETKNYKKKKVALADKVDFENDKFQEKVDFNLAYKNESSDENGGEENDIWEDIYGRTRNEKGAVISSNNGKYVPPAMRATLENQFADDAGRKKEVAHLKRQLKGSLNRLSEANMHSIANQIESLYMNNSRNDMNVTITNLMLEALVAKVLTPERLLLEHIVLLAILHANIGTEVGAYFLQTIINKFYDLFNNDQEVEDKSLDNIVHIIAQLYNCKVFYPQLLFNVLNKFAGKFDEKSIECILLVLKSVGFTLRKDDPLALRDLFLYIHKQATNTVEETRDNPRVKFMLDILVAIKNNNFTKIPNYDTSLSEHLKKIMKSFIRKGNYITQLNISLDDLLKADTRGKWWIVGSAWTGNIEGNTPSTKVERKNYSQEILNSAKRHRMNTDARRDIFCIIMSAEDYLDAFEKLLRLGLKKLQERDIIHVILYGCLHEKDFNPYYSSLARKFCNHDRKYQMILKCAIWDKLKDLDKLKPVRFSNLAQMLIRLFLEDGLPISILKKLSFNELNNVSLRFIRQILIGVMLCEHAETCLSVFAKVAQSDKSKTFRINLRLFIHCFLLKKLCNDGIPEEKKKLLLDRAQIVEKLLSKDKNIRF